VPAPSERTVDGLRGAHRQPLKPAHERERRVALDDQVHVITLHGEVDDPKRFLVSRSQRPPNERKDARRSQ
jgi:hypothetical protein